MKRCKTLTLLFTLIMIMTALSAPTLASNSANNEIFVSMGSLYEEEFVAVNIGEKLSEENVRYGEIDGVQTKIIDNENVFYVNVGESNKLLEITEKANEETAVALRTQYYYVDMSSKTATKLDMDTYINAFDEKTVRVKEPMGIRFKASVKSQAKFEDEEYVLDEYGFIVATKTALSGQELTLDFPKIAKGVGYNRAENIDIVFDSESDDLDIFTGVVKNVPVKNYKTPIVCKTYSKITVGSEQFVVYGEAVEGSIYDVAKKFLEDENLDADMYADLIKIVSDYEAYVEKGSAEFTNQHLETTVDGGKITVSGSFDNTGHKGETYNVYLVTYDNDSNIVKTEKSQDFVISESTSSFSAKFDIFSKEQITKAYVLTSDYISVCKPFEKTVKSLRILSIGNSFSVDAQQWLYGIAKDGGIDNVILGNLYIGGCTLYAHSSNADSNKAAYTYYKNETGVFQTAENKTMLYGITDENWDYITLQQASGYSGRPESYDNYLTNLISYVNKNKLNPDAQLVWHMTWAYDEAYAATSYYGTQQAMYDSIISSVKEKIVSNSGISFIIPAGTAVQNARTSFIGDTFNRDGFHLDYTYGRYLAALTWFHKITGLPVDDISYIPNGSFSEKYLKVLKECAKNAVLYPFEVTESEYKDNPYDLENYTELSWTAAGTGYYNSAGSSNVNTTASNSKYFIYTRIFEKSELPNGTLIVVDNGYQYRPEGWTSLDERYSTRPDNVTTNIVEVNDAWWGSYNYRGFNISVVGANTDLTEKVEETASHFRIYIPKN